MRDTLKLSPHLTYKEATHSGTAIRKGIRNVPNANELVNMFILANNCFEPIRQYFNTPIYVSSFYRSLELNKAIGGASKSDHIDGCAIDLDADVFGEIMNKQIFNFVKEYTDFYKLIWEWGDDQNPAWVHISYKEGFNHLKHVYRAVSENGGVVYKPF